MNQRRHVTLVAAAATLLATAPMSTIFESWTWLIDCILVVAVVCGVALLLRSVRAPVWAQVLGMVAGVGLIATLLFGQDAYLGLIPSGRTLQHFADLVSAAGTDIRDQAVPVPDRDGLLFLTTVGVGGVAVLVDLFAVGLRQPALAGMPMLPMYSIPVIVHQDSVSVLPFVIGSIGYLWLLASDNVDRVRRFGRRFTGDGRDVDLWEPSPLAAAGRRLGVVGVLAAILLPLAIPGMTSGLLDRFGSGGSGIGNGSGSGRGTGSVDLFARLAGSLNQASPFTMIKVKTTDPAPFYLRFGVADQLSQNGFHNRAYTGGDTATDNNFPDPSLTEPGVTQSTFHAEVEVVNFDMGLLPTYTDVVHLSGVDRAWKYDRAGQLIYSESNRVTTKGMGKYNFEYVHTLYTPEALRQAPALGPNESAGRYSQVPVTVPYVKTLVDNLIRGKANEYDDVRALFDYFSLKNQFIYQLTTKTGSSGSDIQNFLTNKAGYCEQYAAALAWLVRQAGFPARVAFGFTLGAGSTGGTYTLTNKNLHAWTEVYFPSFGWVPFDATPTSGLTGAAATSWAPDPNKPVTNTNNGAGGQLPDANASGAPGGADTHDPTQGREGADGAIIPTHRRWPYWVLGGFGALLVLLTLPAATRTLLRRRRRPRYATRRPAKLEVAGARSAPQMRVVPEADRARRDAHAAWDELLDTLVDYRIGIDDAETPRVTVDRLLAKFGLTGESADAVRLLGRVEEHARYARTPLKESGLGPALRALRRAIARRVSTRTRLGALLFPPSVLRRWRTGVFEGFAGAVAWTGRMREGIVRGLRLRRTRAETARP